MEQAIMGPAAMPAPFVLCGSFGGQQRCRPHLFCAEVSGASSDAGPICFVRKFRVPVELHSYPGAIHAFNVMAEAHIAQCFNRDLMSAIARMLAA